MTVEPAPEAERFRDQPPSYQHLKAVAREAGGDGALVEKASIYCGWGRIIMGHTYADPQAIAAEMLQESRGKRDIAMYVSDPHLVLAAAPQQLFLDPSDTYRLDLREAFGRISASADVTVRRVSSRADAEALNQMYVRRDMVPTDPEYVWSRRASRKVIFLVAEDMHTGEVIGTVTGRNHIELFKDPTGGGSLWCLAVDPQAQRPGVGELLVRSLADYLLGAGCRYMDLSVLHDNEQAKELYRKLGFRQVHTFALKSKNAYNEVLFLGPDLSERLNPYARIIVDEARSRGITVEVLDAEEGYFRLSRGGKSVTCRESLSDFTTAVAMSRCQDKYVTNRWLRKAGFNTPAFRLAGQQDANMAFLEQHGQIVVKPSIGEQGQGISVGVSDEAELDRALALARRYGERVMLESYHPGVDLRIVVIGFEVVAAAVRRPPQVIGDGVNDFATLIEKQSRRRSAATGGESSIPIDAETERCLATQGLELNSVPEPGRVVEVRKTANLHTGGTIHDVTHELHPQLIVAAEEGARHLDIPVVGFDFMVESPQNPTHVIIEANERVGLANHEPQPTAQRFIDLLYPLSIGFRANVEVRDADD